MDFLLSFLFIPKQTYIPHPTPIRDFVALEAPDAPPLYAPVSYILEVIEEVPTEEVKTAPEGISEATGKTEQEVEDLIIKYAKEYDIDPLIPLNIAWSESQFRNVPNFMYDGEDGKYTAWGIFQFTITTFVAYGCGTADERKVIEKNIECAIMILATEKNGHAHWLESYEMNGRGWKYLGYRSQENQKRTNLSVKPN